MKTDFMQTVNLLTIELQLIVEGSNNYHFLKKNIFKKSEKSYLFFKTRFKIFFWFVGAQFFTIQSCLLFKITSECGSGCSYIME